MQHRRRRIALLPGLALSAAGMIAALGSLGCSESDMSGERPVIADGGGGVMDAATFGDSGPVFPRSDAAVPFFDGGGAFGEDDAPAGVGCFDFLDGDGDRAVDCADSECGATPVCCVGSSSSVCCTDATSDALELAGCTGTGTDALLACAPGVTLFGSPTPELRDGALVPNGGDRFDSGLVLGTTVDPRVSRLEISATVTAGDRCDRCLDSIAFGLVRAAQTLGGTALVDPDLAVMVSTARGELRLLVGGAVAGVVPLADLRGSLGSAELEPVVVRLETTTQGSARIVARSATGSVDVPVFADVPYAPRGPARVVVWGRSANRSPSDPPPARLARIAVVEAVCDAPASLARSNEPILPDALDVWWAPRERALAPSVVGYDDALGERRARMAFVYQGRIHAAAGIEGGRFRALGDPRDPATALLVPGGPEWMAGGIADPELVRSDDGRWQLWLTAISTSGVRSIARADAAMPDQLVFGAPQQVLVADEISGAIGWDAPSIATATIGGRARTFLAARRHSIDAGVDETALALFEITDGPTRAPVPAETTTFDPEAGVREDRGLVRSATHVAPNFDADEVAAPALVAYGGVLRLYYAGRRGTRWSIGVMVSQDARFWREAGEGHAVLSGSGAGFDALSVSDPEPWLEGAELRLYYTGSDGVVSSIGLARHAIPTSEGAL